MKPTNEKIKFNLNRKKCLKIPKGGNQNLYISKKNRQHNDQNGLDSRKEQFLKILNFHIKIQGFSPKYFFG